MTVPTHFDPGAVAHQPRWVGEAGLALHLLLVALVTWRLAHQMSLLKPAVGGRRPATGGGERRGCLARVREMARRVRRGGVRMAFHWVLWVAVLLTTPQKVITRGVKTAVASPWGVAAYSMHLVSLGLTMLAWSLVVVTWARVFSVGERRGGITGVVMLVNLVLCAFIGVVCIRFLSGGVSHFWSFLRTDETYKALIIVVVVTTIIVAVMLLGCGACAICRLLGHMGWKTMREDKKRRGLVVSLLLMAVCAVCFTARGILLVSMYMRWNDRDYDTKGVQQVFGEWLPDVVPTLCLMYFMRRRARPVGTSSPVITSLRYSPAPQLHGRTPKLKGAGRRQSDVEAGKPLQSRRNSAEATPIANERAPLIQP